MNNLSILPLVLSKCTRFKIGKTGTSLEERMKDAEYSERYSYYVSLFDTTSRELASWLEARLIDDYIVNPKCDNIKDGDHSIGDEMTDSPLYHVYIVWT